MARGVKRRGWVWAGALLGLIARTLGAGALFWAIFPVWLSLFWSVQGYPPTLRDLPRWYALGAFNIAPIVAMVLVSPLVLGVLIWFRRKSGFRDSDLTPFSSPDKGSRADRDAFFQPSPPAPSPTAWERGNSGEAERTAPLSHAVGEGLGVRVKKASSTHTTEPNRCTPTRGLESEVLKSTILGFSLYALLAPPIAYALLLIYAEMWQYRAWDAATPTLLRAYLMLAPACGAVGAFVGWTLRR